MRIRYAVTFEFDTHPPITHRGTGAAATMPTCFARAAREAARAHPGVRWSSLTCALLERVDATTAGPLAGQDDAESCHPITRGPVGSRQEIGTQVTP